MECLTRTEQVGDIDKIAQITKNTFQKHPHSNHTEPMIINSLRREQVLALSLVTKVAGSIVGHIAFSEVDISDGSTGWFGLGPVAVAPEMQGKGIGSALVREGLAQLKTQGAQGCVLLGAPSFYRRFGFANDPELMLEEAPLENFLVLPFTRANAHGIVTFHPA